MRAIEELYAKYEPEETRTAMATATAVALVLCRPIQWWLDSMTIVNTTMAVAFEEKWLAEKNNK